MWEIWKGGIQSETLYKYIIISKRKEKIRMHICTILRSGYVLFCLALLFQRKQRLFPEFALFSFFHFLSSQCWFSLVPYSSSITVFIIRSSSNSEHENHAFIFESKSGMGFLAIAFFCITQRQERKFKAQKRKPMNLAWLSGQIIQLFVHEKEYGTEVNKTSL